MEDVYKEWLAGVRPDPDPARAAQTLSELNLRLDNWLKLRELPALFWGWHPEEKNSMAFEHESIRRALVLLGFETVWIRGDAVVNPPSPSDPQIARLFVTGFDQFNSVLPRLNESDTVLVHNLTDYTNWKGKVLNYLQFFANHPSRRVGIPTPYPTDLLPFEISDDCLSQKNDKKAMFVGSRYSSAFYAQHEYLGNRFLENGIRYSFLETWNADKIHQEYCSARWAPVVQQSSILTFMPSRFVKAMSRGCIPLSVNPIIEILLGSGAEACIFGATWNEVFEKLKEIKADPKEMERKSRVGLAYAREHTALHFLEYIWPDKLSVCQPSKSFLETRASLFNADRVCQSLPELHKLLLKYPRNRVLMALIVRGLINQGSLRAAEKELSEFKAAYPDDKIMIHNLNYELEHCRILAFPEPGSLNLHE